MNFSPREFRFVTSCQDYFIESQRLLIVLDSSRDFSDPQYARALADLGTLAHGKGRLWITDSKVSHDKIESLKFRVEISLPPVKRR